MLVILFKNRGNSFQDIGRNYMIGHLAAKNSGAGDLNAIRKEDCMKLTEKEIELIDGMIEAQRSHAAKCNVMQNPFMAEKQKAWDMKRIVLLEKIKAETK